MRCEVHLIHADAGAQAQLVRLARTDASIIESALFAALRPDASVQIVARYSSSSRAEKLQTALTQLGCAAVVVDRGSAISRWMERRFGTNEAPSNTIMVTEESTAAAAAATAKPEDAAAMVAGLFRQDVDAVRRADANLKLRRKILGAFIGVVLFAIFAGVLFLVSSLIEPAQFTPGADRGSDSSASNGGENAGLPGAGGEEYDEAGADEGTAEEAPNAQRGGADQQAPSAEASSPAPEASGERARQQRPPAKDAATSTTHEIVARTLLFLVGLGVGYAVMLVLRRSVMLLPAKLRRPLLAFCVALAALAFALFVYVEKRRSDADDVAAAPAQYEPEGEAAPAPGDSPAATDVVDGSGTPARMSDFVAALDSSGDDDAKFAAMADALRNGPTTEENTADGSGEVADGSGEGSEGSGAGGLRAADEMAGLGQDDVAARAATGSESVSAFVTAIPRKPCSHGDSEFARIACALEERAADDEAGDSAGDTSGEPGANSAQPESGQQGADAAPAANDEAAPADASGEGSLAADGSGREDTGETDENGQGGATPAPAVPPAGSPEPGEAPPQPQAAREPARPPQPAEEESSYVASSLAFGFLSGSVLELIIAGISRRRRRRESKA